jgi:hypothetical protein
VFFLRLRQRAGDLVAEIALGAWLAAAAVRGEEAAAHLLAVPAGLRHLVKATLVATPAIWVAVVVVALEQLGKTHQEAPLALAALALHPQSLARRSPTQAAAAGQPAHLDRAGLAAAVAELQTP